MTTDKASHRHINWTIPVLFAMFGFYVQSVCLHYATYSYVHKYALDSKHPPQHNEYATLADPIEELLGQSQIKIQILDAIAGLFPLSFVVVCFNLAWWSYIHRCFTRCRGRPMKKTYLYDMRANILPLWSKVMLCAGLLFILKGIIGAVTTVPDSSGWEVCKERLKPEGVAWMKEQHSFLRMFFVDFWWNWEYHHPLRYCSDMMFSGHTFVVTLFALGLYELIRTVRPTEGWTKRRAEVWKVRIMIFLAFVTVGEQSLEVYLVEKTRFHYTSDIIVAFVMTFSFYTNGVIVVASKKWSENGVASVAADRWTQVLQILNGGRLDSCLDEWDTRWAKAEDDHKKLEDLEQATDEHYKEWHHLVSAGDIFVPPCCIPFCCYAGREHIYDDDQVKRIIRTFVLPSTERRGALPDTEKTGVLPDTEEKGELMKPLQEYLKSYMNFSEGVSMHDFMAFTGDVYSQLPPGPSS